MNYKELIWESYHHRFGLAGEDQADVIQGILEQHPGLVLNVGCAFDGARIARLAAHCRVQVAIDKEPNMVQKARSTCPASNVVFLAADAQRMSFQDGCAECVVALGLFAYAADPVPIMRELHRVTIHGGFIMITNSVFRPVEVHKQAGAAVGLTLIKETEGYCPAASGNIKRRYLLVFSKD